MKQQITKVLQLPKPAQKLRMHYQNLQIQGLKIACPYHINTGLYTRHRALVGKGRPEEIEAAAEKYLDKFKMHADGDVEKLERYMLGCGFGVDCSGFVAWMLNAITMQKLGKPIQDCLTFPGVGRRLVSKVRPFENISANLLTNTTNSLNIAIKDIRPGDLIRVIHGHHVMMISEVGLHNGMVVYFKYIHSTIGYGNRRGVQEDYVDSTAPDGDLLDQHWADERVYADLQKSADDSRVVRLRALL